MKRSLLEAEEKENQIILSCQPDEPGMIISSGCLKKAVADNDVFITSYCLSGRFRVRL